MTKLREMKKAEAAASKGSNSKVLVLSAIGAIAVIAVIAFVAMQPTGLSTLPEAEPEGTGNNGPGTPPVIGEIRTFTDTGKQIELQGGKPVIRLFSATWCPHCKWIKDTYDRVASEYVAAGKIVAYHWEVDISDNTLTPIVEGSIPESELAVFREFNPRGSIPTFVFGGKYFRIGNGYEMQDDLAAEEAEFRGVIEALIAEASE